MSAAMLRLACLLFLLIGIVPAACTTMPPRTWLPPPLTNENFDERVKVVTFPLPVIASSPNEGQTYGALTAFLLHNRDDEVGTLIAPQLNQNPNLGTSASLYAAFYPNTRRNWEIYLSKSTEINEFYEIRFHDETYLRNRLELDSYAFIFSEGTSRFYGFGPGTSSRNETNYTNDEKGFDLSSAYGLPDKLKLLVGERYRRVGIRRGVMDSVSFIKDEFDPARVPGAGGFVAHAQRFGFIYNSLDHPRLPKRGLYGTVFYELSAKFLGSDRNFSRINTEIKGYFPTREERLIAIVRLAYTQVFGKDTPFLEQSILGGENTLRGFGRNRFFDKTAVLFNLEERIRVWRARLFNVDADIEIAPFVDIGSVMSSLSRFKFSDLEVNPGIGFRGVVRPNFAGRIDIGFGRDGAAVFVGLGYPF